MKWLISRAGGDGGRRRGGRAATSINDSLLHPHFSACPPSFWSAEEVRRWLNSQSVTNSIRPTLQSGSVFSLVSCQPTTENFCQWLWLFLNLPASRWPRWAEVIKQSPLRCEQRKGGGAYSVVQAGDHGVRHPGAEPWAGCAHCDGIADAGQLPTACRSKPRNVFIQSCETSQRPENHTHKKLPSLEV